MKFDDALSRVAWQDFEVLVANHFRDQGFDVMHCGDGRFGRRDGSAVDLRLRKDGRLTLVQCRHATVSRIDAAAVARLLALRAEDGADGAIVISSGDVPEAARKAAEAGGAKVIDGVAVRAMLGERLTDLHPVRSLPGVDAQHGEAHVVVQASIPRSRGRRGARRQSRWPVRGKRGARVAGVLLALALLVVGVYFAPVLKRLAGFAGATPPAATQPADDASTVQVPLPTPPAH